jgi:hypothetical protein
MRRVIPAVLVVCIAVCFYSVRATPLKPEPGPPTPAELAAGETLAEHVRSAIPETNSEFHGTLIIKREGTTREIPITCRVTVGATNWQTDYEIAPTAQSGAEHLAVVHNIEGPNQYLYAQAASPGAPLPKLEPIPPSDAAIPLAGSDFSLADLGLEFLHWPVQRELKDAMRLGEPCYVLESSNPRAGEIVKVRSYIDKDYGAPLIADAYDAGGNLIKEFSLHGSSFKKVNGRWQLEKMDIRNKKTGSRTELKFDLNK